ncbi:hypothetical protein BV898_03462 [Hypsibius exemplaris]|uniref:Uncharacterized protein n=1 Tax=Hypsibius exemplaris TaxID=2072580 RepID=A0A1W0X4Z2_HYPEX|nr:hypothetical protein BV898_03462 [Hypsibius exemplaris]
MAATRRLTKELQDLKTQSPKVFRDIIVDEQNFFKWPLLLMPVNDMNGCLIVRKISMTSSFLTTIRSSRRGSIFAQKSTTQHQRAGLRLPSHY